MSKGTGTARSLSSHNITQRSAGGKFSGDVRELVRRSFLAVTVAPARGELRIAKRTSYFASSGMEPSQLGGGVRACWVMKRVRKSLAWSSGGTACRCLRARGQSRAWKAARAAS